jgi:hypothetical protein
MNKHRTTYLSLYETVNNGSTSGIASDVECCTYHVEDTIEGVEQW